MNIDLNITYDDLSDRCKSQIKKLRDMGYKVNIVYPRINRSDVISWTSEYPYSQVVPCGGTCTDDPSSIRVTNASPCSLDPNTTLYCQTEGKTAL